jgi:hypothetical protein
MNIKCSFCQTPYTLSRVEMIDALQEMDAQKLNHYDAHCPRCKRATPIQRARLEMMMPKWREELKKLEVELKDNPQIAASMPNPPSVPPSGGETGGSGPEPVPAKAKAKSDTKAKPPSKTQIGQKPAARAELGKKPPAKNTPSQGKKRNK